MTYTYTVSRPTDVFRVALELRPYALDGHTYEKLAASLAGDSRILPTYGDFCFRPGPNCRGAGCEWWSDTTPTDAEIQAVGDLAQLTLSTAMSEAIRISAICEHLRALGGNYWSVEP